MRKHKPFARRISEEHGCRHWSGPVWQGGIGASPDTRHTEAHTGKGRQTFGWIANGRSTTAFLLDQPPTVYRHRVPVLRLAHLATPVFPDVDMF